MTSLGFNFGAPSSATASVAGQQNAEKKAQKKTQQEKTPHFDLVLDGIFKKSAAFVPPKVDAVIVRKRVPKSYQKIKRKANSDDEDDGEDDGDDDSGNGGSENEGDSEDDFVDRKIQPRRKRQKIEEKPRKMQRIDTLEESRLKFLTKQSGPLQKRKEHKQVTEDAEDTEDEEGSSGEEEEDSDTKDNEDLDDEGDDSGEREEEGGEEAPPGEKGDAKGEENKAKGDKDRKGKDDPEKIARTLFLGNLPITALDKAVKKELMKKFSVYGPIDSIRFRSIALAAPNIPKRYGVAQKKLHPDKDNLNGYIVFKSSETVEKALVENGAEFHGKHLRVDRVTKDAAKKDNKKTVFVGNISFKATEEEIRDFFKDCGDIANVRLIRDKALNIGKGFGYVLFKERSSVPLALELNGTSFAGRPLRVSHAVDSEKLKIDKKQPHKSQKGKQRGPFKPIEKFKKGKIFEGERAEVGKTPSLRKKAGASKPVIGKKKARTRGPDYFARKEERRKNKKPS